MILMRRLHIINWMYYGIQTIELQNSNLFAGPTGSGKSSIIDALQVIVLGDISPRNFNRAATGSKSDRSIVTYLRGKSQENDYKRKDKAFSSYIVADFYDELHRDEFSYGVVFDLDEDDTHEKDYFYSDRRFSMECALKTIGNRKVARSRKEFKDEMKARGLTLKLFAPVEYRNDLLMRLGIYDERFFQVFRNAVAYEPLDKIELFIIQNICHMEDNIDVPGMRTAIHEYQRMQRDMSEFIDRRRTLEEIKVLYDEFSSRYETYLAQEYIIERAKVERLREEQLEAEENMSRVEDEREACTLEGDELNKRQKERSDRRIEIARLKESDAEGKRKDDLGKQYQICDQKIKEIERKRDDHILLLEQRLSAWQRRLHEAIEKPVGEEPSRTELKELSRILGLYSQYSKENFGHLDPLSLSEANRRLEQVRNNMLVIQTNHKILRDELRRKTEEYKSQLEELGKGIKIYPKDLLALRAHLQHMLSEQDKPDVQIYILADLISINDPEWVNVIEGYLRRQKLYLLIAPENYKETVRIFRKYSRDNRCYSYRLVNTTSILAEDMTVLDNSLARVVETEHPAARKYVDFLLGRVERVEDIEYIGGRRTAVTAEGMLYAGFAAARINEDDWRMKCIGHSSIEQQIDEVKRLLEADMKQIGSLNSIIAYIQPWEDEKTISDEFIDNLEQAVAGTRELPTLNKECDELWAQFQSIDDSYRRRLDEEDSNIHQELSDLLNKIKDVNIKIGKLEQQHTTYFELSNEKEQAWEEAGARFSTMYPEGDQVALGTADRYERELLQKGTAEKVKNDFEKGLNNTKGRMDTLKENFRKKLEEYNYRHTASSINTDISSSEWRNAYEEAHSIQLEMYTDKVTAARNRAEEMFHNEFINQIKRNIDTVRREIRLLNNAMEEYTFGKVQYRFKCVPTENTEMRQYYEMITNLRLDGASIYDLVEPGKDMSEYEPLVKTLFQLIASEGTDAVSRKQIEENIEKYKSLKSYLRFDLVEVGADGKEYPLSRTIRSKSGGERQTPFYVAILASLMKTYRVNQNVNSIRLVVFDEVFDKIDTSRIEECISMLKEIGFQFIIAAPDNKAPYISPLVESTWVVIKPDEMTSVLHLHQKNPGGSI